MIHEAVIESVFDRLESNVRSYCRHFPTTFIKGEGSWIYEREGRKVLDLLCGAGSLNYGHNDPAILSAVIAYMQAGGMVLSLDLHTEAKEQFLTDIEEVLLKPRGLDFKVQFPGPAGTNAVEAALKLARRLTGRSKVAAFERGFHGVSLGSLATCSNAVFRAAAGVPLENVIFWPYPCEDSGNGDQIALIAESLSLLPADQLPAAVIIEMVQGDGGLRFATAEKMRQLAALCKEYGILLIADDIQAGCGRTGSFFSFDQMGVVPDIVLLSKSLSGIGTPLAITLLRRELDVWHPGEHNGTFRGNNLGFVGASAALNRYWREPDFAEDLEIKARGLWSRLESIRDRYPDLVRMRGRGFMLGLEFTDPDLATTASRRLFERQVMAETCGKHGQTLKLLPPLNISENDLEFGLEALADAVDAACCGKRVLA